MNEKRIRLHLIDSVQNFKAYFQSSLRMFRHTISTLLELVCWGRISIFRVNTLLRKLRLIYNQRRLWPFSSSPVSKDYSLPGFLEQHHCIFDTICSYQREQSQQSLPYTSCDLKTIPGTLKDLP